MEHIYCGSCGLAAGAGSRFCVSCGTPLVRSDELPSAAARAFQPPDADVLQEHAPPQAESSSASPVGTPGLVAPILLGLLGAWWASDKAHKLGVANTKRYWIAAAISTGVTVLFTVIVPIVFLGVLAASLGGTAPNNSPAVSPPGNSGGSEPDGSPQGTGDPSVRVDSNKIAKIGVIAPLSGDLSSLGLGIQHSVELAVKQANDSNAIPGWTLEVEAKDDEAKPDVGMIAATAFVGEADVAGVVGSLNSSVAQSIQPVFAAGKIVQVSPANTNPTLTQGDNFRTAPVRTYATYFRTCTTDLVQGPFAARYLFQELGFTRVATIHDNKTYGQGLVDTFTTEFNKLGGTIADAETINPDDDSKYQAVIAKVKSAAPQAVYYGGEYPQAGLLSQQMKGAGLNVPLMGGDGINAPQYISLGGATSQGDFATTVGAPTDKFAAGQKFLADYDKAGFKEPAAAYGAYSYDAANAIINALRVSLKDAADVASARPATIDALGAVSFDGATGKVAFDQYGDTTTRMLTVYKVAGGKWGPVHTGEFK